MVVPRSTKPKHRLMEVAPVDTFIVKYVNPRREEKVGLAVRTDVEGGLFFLIPDTKTNELNIKEIAPNLLSEIIVRLPKQVNSKRIDDIEFALSRISGVQSV